MLLPTSRTTDSRVGALPCQSEDHPANGDIREAAPDAQGSTRLDEQQTEGPKVEACSARRGVESGTGMAFRRVAVSLAVKCSVIGFPSEAGLSHPHPRSAQYAELGSGQGPTCSGGDGWESNPPGTAQHRPTDGFEDRERHQPPNIPGGLSLPQVARAFFKGPRGLA